jgi:hypothetical protein
MDKVAIFGKKGSIAKYDLVKNKPVWVGDISPGYKPNIIGQFEDYIIEKDSKNLCSILINTS